MATSSTRTYVYITFFSKREMLEAESVEEAKAFLLQLSPQVWRWSGSSEPRVSSQCTPP